MPGGRSGLPGDDPAERDDLALQLGGAGPGWRAAKNPEDSQPPQQIFALSRITRDEFANPDGGLAVHGRCAQQPGTISTIWL